MPEDANTTDPAPVADPDAAADPARPKPPKAYAVAGFYENVRPEFLPREVGIEAAFAAVAAIQHGDIGGELSTVKMAGALGWNPFAIENPNDERQWEQEWFERFVERWTFRAAIRFGNLSAAFDIWGDPYPTGNTLGGVAIGKEAEAAIAERFNATLDHKNRLKAGTQLARTKVRDWYNLRGAKPAPPAAPFQREAPEGVGVEEGTVPGATRYGMNPVTINAMAALFYAGLLSEGAALESLCAVTAIWDKQGGAATGRRGIRSRLELREEFQDAVARGAAFLRGDGDGMIPKPAERKKDTPADAVACPCPVCLYLFWVRKSLAMNCGMNVGGARCIACESALEIRAYRGDELNAEGDMLRAFRENEAPDDLPIREAEPGGRYGRVYGR